MWAAYVKMSSKLEAHRIGRDEGDWRAFGEQGFESVRMVAIDDDWSTIRFRRTDFIKTMTRDKDFAMSEAGKPRP